MQLQGPRLWPRRNLVVWSFCPETQGHGAQIKAQKTALQSQIRAIKAGLPGFQHRRWPGLASSSAPGRSRRPGSGFSHFVRVSPDTRGSSGCEFVEFRSSARQRESRVFFRGDPVHPTLFTTVSTAVPPCPASRAFRSVAHPHRTGEHASGALGRKNALATEPGGPSLRHSGEQGGIIDEALIVLKFACSHQDCRK